MNENIIPFPGNEKQPLPEAEGYVLKVTLRHTKPPVWRRLLVPSGITLNQLHNIIQEAMGWFDCHLHSFRSGNREWGIPDPDFPDGVENDTHILIDKVFKKEGQKLLYTYDFGDNWEHDVIFEGRKENPGQDAILLAGKRACPPEDCGGVYGYQDILNLLSKKKHTKEERELLEWFGDDYDADELDFEDINEVLRSRDWLECRTEEW